MTRYPWFRLYTEARNDSKLDALNDREFRIWFKMLCLAAEGSDRGTIDYIDPEFVAMELRVHVDELDSAISRMIRLRLLERSESKIVFKSFKVRQYDSPSDAPDAVRERVRKSRARKASGTDVTTSNDLVTNRTDKNRKEKNIGGVGDVDNSEPPLSGVPVHISEIIRKSLEGKAPK
jgi:hypothetical protein